MSVPCICRGYIPNLWYVYRLLVWTLHSYLSFIGNDGGLTGGEVAGVVLGIIIFIIVIVVLLLLLIVLKKRTPTTKKVCLYINSIALWGAWFRGSISMFMFFYWFHVQCKWPFAARGHVKPHIQKPGKDLWVKGTTQGLKPVWYNNEGFCTKFCTRPSKKEKEKSCCICDFTSLLCQLWGSYHTH